MLKSVVILGSGNVASALAVALSFGSILRQVVSRNIAEGQAIADSVGCEFSNDFSSVADADIYVIAVSDKAVSEVSRWLIGRDGLVVHTAGSLPLEALDSGVRNRGILYPLQTFTKGRDADFSTIPLLLECEHEDQLTDLKSFASQISERVVCSDYDRRLRLHLAAVFVCNFVNQMYVAGEHIAGGDAALLNPLVGETAAKLLDAESAVPLQTGPAVRGDRNTMNNHIELLNKIAPQWVETYNLLSEIIKNGKF